MTRPLTTPLTTPLTVALTLVAVMTLAACNTIEGAGRDLSTAGDAMSEEARRAQQ